MPVRSMAWATPSARRWSVADERPDFPDENQTFCVRARPCWRGLRERVRRFRRSQFTRLRRERVPVAGKDDHAAQAARRENCSP
jgi:hypothetical protein